MAGSWTRTCCAKPVPTDDEAAPQATAAPVPCLQSKLPPHAGARDEREDDGIQRHSDRRHTTDLAASSADPSHHFKSDPWRTSSPLHPNLGFRFTHGKKTNQTRIAHGCKPKFYTRFSKR